MHEISLIRTVFNTLEAEFSPEELSRLQAVDLKVGLLSNVEPILLQNAFAAVTQSEGKYETATLNIESVPIEVYCPVCDKNSPVKDYKFACSCGRPSSDVVSGTELLIHRIHFAEPASVRSA
ncbi:hydrogenase maturation nickel metallochaperone HypA [Phaeodactylibacter xiamenensis]|uniref:hydrogenase maturation nickel metallochaperone HypA/HybF n=3 Tax=Phaeodactylibacter xiamenensis TaxID=1524460 RepID=UPI003BAB064E